MPPSSTYAQSRPRIGAAASNPASARNCLVSGMSVPTTRSVRSGSTPSRSTSPRGGRDRRRPACQTCVPSMSKRDEPIARRAAVHQRLLAGPEGVQHRVPVHRDPPGLAGVLDQQPGPAGDPEPGPRVRDRHRRRGSPLGAAAPGHMDGAERQHAEDQQRGQHDPEGQVGQPRRRVVAGDDDLVGSSAGSARPPDPGRCRTGARCGRWTLLRAAGVGPGQLDTRRSSPRPLRFTVRSPARGGAHRR